MFSGTLLEDTFPPRPLSVTPLFGYRLERSTSYRGPGNIFLFGPRYSKRSLSIPEPRIRSWLQQNRHVLASARAPTINRRFPYILVVLSEWVSETWTHISWGKSNSSRMTTIGLFQRSEHSAPQWNYLRMKAETLLMTTMDGNLRVIHLILSLISGAKAVGCCCRWDCVLYSCRI